MKKTRIVIIATFAFILGAMSVIPILKAADGTIVIWTGMAGRRNTTEFEIREPAVGSAADFIPGTDNANSLGNSSLAFDDVQTYDLTAQDDVTIGDALTVSGQVSLSTVTMTGVMNILLDADPNTNLTVTTTGQLVFNTTSFELCMSTSDAAASFVYVSSATTVCS